MSVRKQTTNRLTLYRTCHICGKNIITTADTPWIRRIPNVNGKKEKTCYFCSEKCFASSYKHIGFYDGKADKRRKEKEMNRDKRDKNYRYYHSHEKELREKRKKRYLENREEELLSNKYYKMKRKLMKGDDVIAENN